MRREPDGTHAVVIYSIVSGSVTGQEVQIVGSIGHYTLSRLPEAPFFAGKGCWRPHRYLGEIRRFVADDPPMIWLHVTIGSPPYVNHADDQGESGPLVVGLRLEAPERVFFLGFDYPGYDDLYCTAGIVHGMQQIHSLNSTISRPHVRAYSD